MVLAGDYSGDGFKGCYSELRAQIERLGLGAAVEFTGYISDERLRDLYSSATVFAMPSIDEGFGLPALEAMACGAPVVVSSGNALEEVVGNAGVVCPVGDAAAWARALCSVGDEMRQGSIERAAQFTWDNSARALQAALESL